MLLTDYQRWFLDRLLGDDLNDAATANANETPQPASADPRYGFTPQCIHSCLDMRICADLNTNILPSTFL
jgi:hypothetical protein